jgi:hypothetical protein
MLVALASFVWRGMLVYWVALALAMHPGVRDQVGANDGVCVDSQRRKT